MFNPLHKILMKNTATKKVLALSLLCIFTLTYLQSCSTTNKTTKGTVIGALAGGTVGALIGKKAGNTAVGALIGGAVGGTAGAFIGRGMDRQAEQLKQTIPGAEVIREGEGIIVKFDSGILFDVSKSELKTAAMTNIQNLAKSLKDNPDTDVTIIGHTDNSGSDEYNNRLSERRAEAVKTFTINQGISASRINTRGKGESEPIADNSTEEGKAKNRRVEIVIVANEKMKADAQKNAG
jgi:outer membrane protein OmpA-like peptidoglycan-associated protein